MEEHLIELVRAYPSLYDVGNPSFKNLVGKENIWEKIGQDLQIPARDCKQKWKSLRDSFSKQQRENKLCSGDGVSKKKMVCKYFSQLQFLSEFVKSRKRTFKSDMNDSSSLPSTNMDEGMSETRETPVYVLLHDDTYGVISDEETSQTDEVIQPESPDEPRPHEHHSEELQDSSPTYEPNGDDFTAQKRRPNRKPSSNNVEFPPEMREVVNVLGGLQETANKMLARLQQAPARAQESRSNSEIDLFCDQLKLKMRRLNCKQQEQLQFMVQKFFYDLGNNATS